MLRFIPLLLIALTVSACGNTDMGAQAYRQKQNSASAFTTVNNSASALTALQGQTCGKTSVYSNGDGSFGQILSGSSLCYTTASPALVQLKLNANIAGARLCVIPVSGDAAGAEACFTTTGYTTSLALSQAAYSGLVVVAEANVGAYKSYLYGQSSVMPPLALAVLAH